MKMPTPDLMKKVVTSPVAVKFYLTTIGFIIALVILRACTVPTVQADKMKEQQIEKLRLEQVELEKKIISIQKEWDVKNKARLDADALLQLKLQDLQAVEAGGKEIRSLIEEKEKKVKELLSPTFDEGTL